LVEPQQTTPHQASIPASLQQLLTEFELVFAPVSSLPPERSCDHSIPLIAGAKPVQVRAYRYPPTLKDEIEKQVADMLAKGLIQPSLSEFSSPVLLVRKKDGSWRFCVDYRYLNALTLKSKFPIPIFEQLMDELAQAKWFSTLDLASGYHQIRLKAGEEYKTAFSTHHGHFEFKVVAFGLSGAPGTFQGAMNTTLAPLLRRCVLVFFDDILVYSASFEEHLQHLRAVFQLLQQDKWQVKLSKCSFAKQSISYLGHVISAAGVATDPSKVEAVLLWPTPTNVKELRSFLGLSGYYRRFVQHYAVIARPLTNLLKKGVLFVWTSDHDLAFTTLKTALSSAPVLAIPDFDKTFCIETDACATGVGAVLLQDGHPLAFISKPLGPKTQGLSTYEKEYLAILLAIEHWRHYLQLAEFTIFTDQKSLIHLNEQRLNTFWQQKVFTKLLGLNYRIVYKKGEDNGAADALSRRSHPTGTQVYSLSMLVPVWLAELQASYATDAKAQELLAKLSLNSAAVPPFTLDNGVLKYKNRIWLAPSVSLQGKTLEALHNSAVGGHSGVPVTYRRIKQLFYWPGMKKMVQQYVAACSICQQAKPDRSKYPGLLQPLPTPTSAWQMISMDFVEGLPTSGGKNAILVVVDRFSKFGHFIPLRHPFTAQSVAKLFLSEVYKLHGLPISIVSDRDRIFTSTFWKELFGLAGVSLHMSSAYHPQTDGQTERVNQCMETFLRCFVHSCPAQWIHWIALAEFWYNTSFHSALGRSPFEALYGYSPRTLGVDLSACHNTDLKSWLQDKALMKDLVHQHLVRARLRMKHQADKNRAERQFEVGTWVYVKLQPYVQSSLAHRANQKLAFKFFGPFQIISKIGAVAYKLDLPASSSVHPVFHVSQLKIAVPVTEVPSPTLPAADVQFQVPELILQKRLLARGHATVEQVLIKWSGMTKELAT
jgi:transposase InsO family protein